MKPFKASGLSGAQKRKRRNEEKGRQQCELKKIRNIADMMKE